MQPVKLSQGAIEWLSSGEADQSELAPVLQIADLRLVNTQNQNAERYRILLSDGEFSQQGMLATQHNNLVKSGKLQKGSVIQLTQFVRNVIQNRIIIIMIDLVVVLDRCDHIGEPKPYPTKIDGNASSVAKSPAPGQSMVQPLVTTGNPPSYGAGRAISGSVLRPTIGAGSAGTQFQPSGEVCETGPHSYGNSFSGNMNSGRYNPSNTLPVYPKQEIGSGIPRAPLNNYSHQPNSSYHQPSVFTNRGPIVKNEAPLRIIAIAALNMYRSRWTIKARVTAKGELRYFKNPKGEGKVFSFDLLDAHDGEIRVTCFNAVADQFYNQIEKGKVYLISRGTLKNAQKPYNHLNNEYEIMLDSTSTVESCLEDDRSIPQQQFHFRPISDIEGLANNSVLDLIAIVSSINPPSYIMRKNGTETLKRTLQLKDMSGRSVELTLWGNFCNAEGQTLQTMCDAGNFPVLAVKYARVNDFNGKSVGTLSTTQLLIEPDFPEVQKLKTWFNSTGKNAAVISLSREGISRTDVRKAISQIKDEKLGTSEKPDWITVSATISYIKMENFCYTACPLMIGDRQCNKKIINNGDGKWQCERCDKLVDECDYRYILQMQIQDHTGSTYVTAFQETGEEIMGRSAKEMYYMKYEEEDEEKFNELVHAVLHTRFLFKLKVKEETFNDEQRVKSTIVKAEKLNLQTETTYLLDLMAKLKVDTGALAPKSEGMSTPGPTNAGFGRSGEAAAAAAATNYSAISSNVAREGGANMNQCGVNTYGGGSRFPSSEVHTSCGSCGSSAHNSANCPRLMTGPGQSYAAGHGNNWATSAGDGGANCFKCQQPGHWARDCPGVANAPHGGGGSAASGECYKCKQPGHWARDCPGVADAPCRGGGGGFGECYKCMQPGHWAKDCPGVANNATTGRYG